MTDIVTPPTIDALPAAPEPTDTPSEFDTKAFATLAAQEDMVTQVNASNAATHQNAVAANERASAAAGSAGAATSAAGTATTQAGIATTAAGTATTKAAEADASAIAASKLNLGDKSSPPTTDNQGQPLRAGATYYDTTLGKWRVWSGSAWTDGISAVAGVTSFNGQTGAVTDGVVQHISAANADLNTITTSGFYSVGTPTNNGPAGVTSSQLIVSRGGDTATQIVVDKTTGAMFVRAASGLSGTPTWSAWRRVSMHSDVVSAATAGAIDCSAANYFTLAMSGNVTLSVSNVPAGSYSFVLEVNYTSGTLTFPSGTVWAGSQPTLAAGRHLFFMQRAQSGTAGWYASSLTGYSA